MATAETMSRYLNTPGGAVYGFAPEGTLGQTIRPDPRTTIGGLWLASAYTFGGGLRARCSGARGGDGGDAGDTAECLVGAALAWIAGLCLVRHPLCADPDGPARAYEAVMNGDPAWSAYRMDEALRAKILDVLKSQHLMALATFTQTATRRQPSSIT